MALVPFVNVLVPTGSYVATAVNLGLDVATTNDVANGANSSTIQSTGKELLLVFNSAGTSTNLLLTSQPDPVTQRSTNPNPLSIAIPAGAYRSYGPFARTGWADSSGLITMQASATGLRAVVLTLPTVS